MGIYVNPGNEAFQEALNSMIYVDKTKLISYTNSVLNTKQKNMCVSRPRRFGKSMAADMLAAYYSRGCDSHAMFIGRKAEGAASYQNHLNKHNVIRLDVQRFVEEKSDLDNFMMEIERRILAELKEEFSGCMDIGWAASGGRGMRARLKAVLEQIYKQTGEKFIFIIDEWDCIFRIAKECTGAQKKYLDFLRGLFKGAEYVELAYMTGILPIKKYGEHSAINIFDEYSMVDPKSLGEFFGFTEEEVQEQCRKHSVDYDEVKKWYDGYLIGCWHIYNPKSVTDALIWKEFQSYWVGTETYEALKVHIDRNFGGLKETIIEMLGNRHCRINPRKFQNDMSTFTNKDDVLTLLVHLGYLAYDKKSSEVFIPNREIAQEFMNAVDGPGWDGLTQALNQSEDLLRSTWALDGDTVAQGMAAIHSQTASLLKYNNENSLTCAILIAYYSAKTYYLNPVLELPSGKGFADVVYLPQRNVDRPALVIELKWNRSASGAVSQIKDRKYTSWIREYTGDILLVGINYNADNKVHECIIEKYRKD